MWSGHAFAPFYLSGEGVNNFCLQKSRMSIGNNGILRVAMQFYPNFILRPVKIYSMFYLSSREHFAENPGKKRTSQNIHNFILFFS